MSRAKPGSLHSHGGHLHGHDAHGFDLPALPDFVEVFDTTLRDGSQQEGISLSVEDKVRVAEQLDHLGVTFIEGGWPGANPKDSEFFARAHRELTLSTSTLVAFGSTRRPGVAAEDDEGLRTLVEANTPVVCIVAKAWDRHVEEALRTTNDEALKMVADSVDFLVANGKRVFVDLEHFFDGHLHNPVFAEAVARVAEAHGAERLVLCDTNGGTLPHQLSGIVSQMVSTSSVGIGIHCHNDAGVAVANSLAAVGAGAVQVQGCVNGYGERAGNTDLTAAIANLSLKLNVRTIPDGNVERLTSVSHHIAELVNLAPNPQQPFVGSSVFAHKGGLHASAVARRRDLYEQIDPGLVGNAMRVVVSEMAGRSTLAMKAEELGLEIDGSILGSILEDLKELEYQGYHFEVADGSLELLLRRATGWEPDFFHVESFRVITDHLAAVRGGDVSTEATVKVVVGGERFVATAEGNGPVNALDAALRSAIAPTYPVLDAIHLQDYRVRVVDAGQGTSAVTRVLIDSARDGATWTTIGVSENIIEASWQALYDSIVFGLLHGGSHEGQQRTH